MFFSCCLLFGVDGWVLYVYCCIDIEYESLVELLCIYVFCSYLRMIFIFYSDVLFSIYVVEFICWIYMVGYFKWDIILDFINWKVLYVY